MFNKCHYIKNSIEDEGINLRKKINKIGELYSIFRRWLQNIQQQMISKLEDNMTEYDMKIHVKKNKSTKFRRQ